MKKIKIKRKLMKCEKCRIVEEYDGDFPDKTITPEQYFKQKVKKYRCQRCHNKGFPIIYSNNTFACPVCKLDSEVNFEARGIKGPCTACDRCNKWFHLTCLSMTLPDVNTKDKSFCADCIYDERLRGLERKEENMKFKQEEIMNEVIKDMKQIEVMSKTTLKTFKLIHENHKIAFDDNFDGDSEFKNIGEKRKREDNKDDFESAEKKRKVE